LAALHLGNDDRAKGPAELRLPDQADVTELGLNAKIAVTPGPELSKAPVDPAFLSIDTDQPDVAAKLE
jgi:hypothetical protein